MLAENDPLTLKLSSDILKTRGYRTIEIINGKHVIEAAKQHKPDLILLYLELTKIVRMDVIKILRSDKSLQNMSIIAVTDAYELLDEKEAANAGCDALFKKPISVQKLVQKIDEILGRHHIYALKD
jgi:DNA-binding response OmpR family regulator